MKQFGFLFLILVTACIGTMAGYHAALPSAREAAMQSDVHWLKTTLTNNALAVDGSMNGIARILNDHKQMLDAHQTNIILLHHALMNHGHKTNK
jgi:hypothetical protein